MGSIMVFQGSCSFLGHNHPDAFFAPMRHTHRIIGEVKFGKQRVGGIEFAMRIGRTVGHYRHWRGFFHDKDEE